RDRSCTGIRCRSAGSRGTSTRCAHPSRSGSSRRSSACSRCDRRSIRRPPLQVVDRRRRRGPGPGAVQRTKGLRAGRDFYVTYGFSSLPAAASAAAKEQAVIMTDLEQLKYPIGRLPRVATPLDRATRETHLKTLDELPARLRSLAGGLSDRQLETPYRPGGWTIRQVVHHVPESHMNAY